jgi:hypothetical protein
VRLLLQSQISFSTSFTSVLFNDVDPSKALFSIYIIYFLSSFLSGLSLPNPHLRLLFSSIVLDYHFIILPLLFIDLPHLVLVFGWLISHVVLVADWTISSFVSNLIF